MVTAVNSTTANASAATSAKSAGQTTADQQQDRFLKLLVAQLNNQDPMNPMDNAQMTSQMAQINTVSGINQLNETVKSLAAQFTSMQMMQGAGMIGHGVMLQSDTLSIDAGVAKGAVYLQGNADKVSVQILTPGGQVLDTLDLGAQPSGRHAFEWNAEGYTDVGSPVFKVIATAGKQPVAATGLAQDTITAIESNGTSMTLQLKGRPSVAYSAIQAIL
jgi:flagellar basal-body rod modification protein FlgD